MMSTEVLERIVRQLRLVFPLAFTLLFICLDNIYWPDPSQSQFRPDFTYPILWFWVLNRPLTIHFSLIFILATFSDLMSANLIGITAIVFLVLYRLVGIYAYFFRNSSSLVLWLAFSSFLFIALGLEWLAHTLLFWTLISPEGFLLKALITSVSMPVFWSLFRAVDRLFLGPRER